jgi:hypothetical protein
MRRLALTVAALLLPPLVYIALAVTLGLAAVNPQCVPTPAEHGGAPVYLRTSPSFSTRHRDRR